MKKVGIMGGTFDPIHLGHLVIANETLNIYKLDKIIFVPTGNPPHKDGVSASPHDRYLMTVLAAASNEKFIVSDVEVNREDKSYSLETLKQFHKMYPDTEFYFITGTDEVMNLPNWYKPREILKLCKFIAVSRPGMDEEKVQAKVEEIRQDLNGRIDLLQVPMLQISSTEIRERFKNGISAKYLIPEVVEQYIIKNKLYRRNMNTDELEKKLEDFNPKLYAHCVRTMNEAERLALQYGADVQKAKIAGLLHDCGKKLKEKDNLTHSKTGAEVAEEVFNIHDEEILNAIRYHTTGRKNMTMLEKIIFIADKIEPGRQYEGVDELRKKAYFNIDEAIAMSLKSTVEYVKMRNLELDEDSLITLRFYKEGK